ncbi:MAG: helix-turn-helix domain-containing protein [Paenibacillus sp.]|uniref:helix-turn-helix domain-containing protein n=1 Tax=Paenibacillus sp. TaxID=58172 RepID=UPI00290069AF|nr:helix-turn-helix domain-containing protein [Paenibacillus sp.]MDU2240441.1 helix-turn-helix domain-containing protein [Paenibacillus sp.]
MAETIQQRLIEWSVNELWHNFHCPFQQNQYYIPYPHMIRKCYALSMNERGVLLDILSHLGQNEEAFPSQETIASNLGISESTVKSAVTTLEQKGFIKTVRRRGHVNRYRVNNLENNPYIAYSEAAHYFLRYYQPKYVKKSLIQSVIADVIHSEKYALHARRLREVYRSTVASDVPYPDLAYDIVSELLLDIRMKLWEEKGIQVSLPIYSDFWQYAGLYLKSIGFEDGDECDWDEYLNTGDEEDPTQGQ